MPIFNIFKKKKKRKKGKLKEEKVEKREKPKEKLKEKGKELPPPPPRKKSGEVKVAPFVLQSPHISERATRLAEGNQYVFKVYSGASKQEIKKAIEEIYGVKVLKVRTIKVPRKKKRLGRTLGWRKGYRKAIVKIKEGQSIEIMPR